MADNVLLNPGSGGSTVRTDEIGGVQYPTSKISLGADGDDDGFVSSSNPLPIINELESPQTSTDVALTVSAGSSGTINSTQISSGKTGKLVLVRVASTVSFKAILQTVSNGVATNKDVSVKKYEWLWSTPHINFITVAQDAGVGLDGFRVVVTNLDPSLPADIYATFYWDEVV